MVHFISQNEIFITTGRRSESKYWLQLSKHILTKFGRDAVTDNANFVTVISECYNWVGGEFVKLIANLDDFGFVTYLFTNHEASIRLWKRMIAGEDIENTINVTEGILALNRRILKLAIEQTCDVTYTRTRRITPLVLQEYVDVVEDLLYLGAELIGFAQFLAEDRMIKNTLSIYLDDTDRLLVLRPPHLEGLFLKLIEIVSEDCKKGIIDEQAVPDFKQAILNHMHIDYDFAGGQIQAIKDELDRIYGNGNLQTIEEGILVQNLINTGVNPVEAKSFYDGLTISRSNKLSLTESVYKVNAMERYIFRPILMVNHNGNNRALIGMEKWAESIVTLSTNCFQWKKSPVEWSNNTGFVQFLNQKSNEHDKLLENPTQKILEDENLPFDRNMTYFSDGKSNSVNVVRLQGVGEMDFVWIDIAQNKIIVADCKYNRARYDMIAYSADYSTFTGQYEKKISGKVAWVRANKDLVVDHFKAKYPGLVCYADDLDVEGIFIINTPTFYMFYGGVKTVCFFNLKEFIKNKYAPPLLAVSEKTARGCRIRVISYPYFNI